MTINIKYTNLDSTPAIRQFVEEKVNSLAKPLKNKGVAKATVEIARSTKHHQKGDIYHAECNLELPGKLLRAESENWDVRLAVNEVCERLSQEITKYLAKVRPQDSRGQKELRKLRGK